MLRNWISYNPLHFVHILTHKIPHILNLKWSATAQHDTVVVDI